MPQSGMAATGAYNIATASVLSGYEDLLCRWSLLLGGYYKGLMYRDRIRSFRLRGFVVPNLLCSKGLVTATATIFSGREGLLCRWRSLCCKGLMYRDRSRSFRLRGFVVPLAANFFPMSYGLKKTGARQVFDPICK